MSTAQLALQLKMVQSVESALNSISLKHMTLYIRLNCKSNTHTHTYVCMYVWHPQMHCDPKTATPWPLSKQVMLVCVCVFVCMCACVAPSVVVFFLCWCRESARLRKPLSLSFCLPCHECPCVRVCVSAGCFVCVTLIRNRQLFKQRLVNRQYSKSQLLIVFQVWTIAVTKTQPANTNTHTHSHIDGICECLSNFPLSEATDDALSLLHCCKRKRERWAESGFKSALQGLQINRNCIDCHVSTKYYYYAYQKLFYIHHLLLPMYHFSCLKIRYKIQMKTNPSIVDSAFRRERGKWMSAFVSVCTVFVCVLVSAAAAVSFAQTRCWRIDFAAAAVQTEL